MLNSWLESKTCTLVAGLIHSWNCCRCTASPLDSSRLLSVCARVYERVCARACLRGSDKHATPSPQNLNDLMSVFKSTCVTKCVFFCAGLTFKFLWMEDRLPTALGNRLGTFQSPSRLTGSLFFSMLLCRQRYY